LGSAKLYTIFMPRKKQLKDFWNDEYKDPGFFALSTVVSSDLEKWVRWMQKEFGRDVFRPGLTVLDLGTGNGRNLLYLCEQFGMSGIGFDISEEGIKQGRQSFATQNLGGQVKIEFKVHSIKDPLPVGDESVDFVLDMMTSHFLKEDERRAYLKEVLRVLKPEGFLFFKSFFATGDFHAKRLVKEHGAGEENAYIHPKMKVYEYVWTDEAIENFWGKNFHMLAKHISHKHFNKGKPNKRRSVVCYFQKK
jgi:ubiquinone/menaquinone biosynthesis C-methylase UbiE